MTTDPAALARPTAELRLPIAGMTCASCVNRIERFLKKTPGVETATVNLATETATIRYLPELAGHAELAGAIEAAGYDLKPAPAGESTASRSLREAAEADAEERSAAANRLLREAAASIRVAAAGTHGMIFAPPTLALLA